MAVNHYEGMFILDSGRFGADPDAAAREIGGVIDKIGATMVAHRPWQDAKLAYPINGHRKGLYYLTFFTSDSSAVNEINNIVRLNDNILRHLVIRHPAALFNKMVERVSGGEEAFRHEETAKESAPKREKTEPAGEDAAKAKEATEAKDAPAG